MITYREMLAGFFRERVIRNVTEKFGSFFFPTFEESPSQSCADYLLDGSSLIQWF